MLADLLQAKTAFGGDSERNRLIAAIVEHHPPCPPNVLDVGTGDGTFARALFSRLPQSEAGCLVAIDPEFREDSLQLAPRITYLRSKIESFSPDGTIYTCVNMRQSVYYFDNPRTTVDRAVEWLRIGGLLALTFGTNDCILSELHEAIRTVSDKPRGSLDLTVVFDLLLASGKLELAFGEVVPGGFDAEMVSRDAAIADATFNLASRNLNVSHFSAPDRISFVREFLASKTTQLLRLNEVRIYRRIT